MFFLNPTRRFIMAKKLDPAELVSFKELLMANSIQIDALCQLLIEKKGDISIRINASDSIQALDGSGLPPGCGD
jgi:hypothetical protein